jgi:hypothetical protein
LPSLFQLVAAPNSQRRRGSSPPSPAEHERRGCGASTPPGPQANQGHEHPTFQPSTALARTCSPAAVLPPIAGPANGPARADDGARQVAECGRHAPGGGPAAPGRSIRHARHRRGTDKHVSGRKAAFRASKYAYQTIARVDRANGWTRLVRAASAVHLARRYTCNSNSRAFGAPDRTIAVPYRRRGAGECSSGRDDARKNEKHHCSLVIARSMRSRSE